MPWSLKTGPIPDKVSALLVYDTDDNEPILIMSDGNTKTLSGGGLEALPVGNEPTYPACTSGQWGFAEGGQNIATRTITAFNPSYLRAIDGVQGGLPPIDVRDDADAFEATSFMILYNDAIALGGGLELLWGNDATDGLGIATTNAGEFAMSRHTGPPTAQSTTVYPTGTPFAICGTGRRHNGATSDDELFYATRAGGTLASIAGPNNNTGIGNNKFFRDWGRRQTAVSMDADTYMFIIFNQEKVSLAEFQTIFDDPLGTLIDTGAGGTTGSGIAVAQPSAVAGAGDRIIPGDGLAIAASATASGVGTVLAAVQVHLTVATNRELRNQAQTPLANKTLSWEWYDTPGETLGDPIDSGTIVTNAGGEAIINVLGSSLANTQEGQLVLYDPADPYTRGTFRVPVTD